MVDSEAVVDFTRVRSHGGLAYGLELARDSSLDLPVRVVPWIFVPTHDVNARSIGEASELLGSMVLRWSDAKPEEFTAIARRGDKHRATNRIPAGASPADLGVLAEAAVAVMPPGAVGAVLQQAIDVSSGCLADIEIRDGTVEVEFRTDLARVLVRRSAGDCVIEAIGSDPRMPNPATIDELIAHLTTMASCLPSTEHGWQLEGALQGGSDSFAVLQLRPTPGDRHRIHSRPSAAWTESTGYVWGVFDFLVDALESTAIDVNGDPVAMFVREHAVDTFEPGALTALEAGRPVLVLNRASGFRLTHESFNLPAAHLRAGFYAAHVPRGVSERFRVVSDGDTARFVEA